VATTRRRTCTSVNPALALAVPLDNAPPLSRGPPPRIRCTARRLAPRAPRTQDQNTETRRLGLLPPWSIFRPQTGFIILTSIQWIINPGGHLEGLPGSITPGKANGPRLKRDHAAEAYHLRKRTTLFYALSKKKKEHRVPTPPAPVPVTLVPVGNRTLWAGLPSSQCDLKSPLCKGSDIRTIGINSRKGL
jgi:hypothetical protein